MRQRLDVKTPMYPSSERKQLEKPSSWTRRKVSSGALKGLMMRPSAIGLRDAGAGAARGAPG